MIKEVRHFGDELLIFIACKAINQHNFEKIDRLQMVKIVYLLDRLFLKTKGDKISRYNFIRHKLGPFSPEIVSDLNNLVSRGTFANKSTYYDYTIIGVPETYRTSFIEIKHMLSEPNVRSDVEDIFELAKDIGDLLTVVENREEVIATPFGMQFVF